MRRACGSRAAVGSSRKTHLGVVDQRAGDGEPLGLAAGEVLDPGVGLVLEPDPLQPLVGRLRGPTPYSEAKVWICSRAVSRSKNDDAWSWTPIRGSSAELRGQTGWPSTVTVPESGRRSPSMVSRVVVLPAPLGPRMPTNSPSADLEADAVDGAEVAVGHGEVDDLDRPSGHARDARHRTRTRTALPKSIPGAAGESVIGTGIA